MLLCSAVLPSFWERLQAQIEEDPVTNDDNNWAPPRNQNGGQGSDYVGPNPGWLRYVLEGVAKYCALLDEPRPAPTSQVGVVTELLVISREAQELVEVHAELLRQV